MYHKCTQILAETRNNDIVDSFLPGSINEVKVRGWDEIDVIIFSGDAYVDHPSFGPPVIGRILEDEGLRVALIPQPNWRDDLRDFKKLGKPRLFFGVSAGNMDSMVNHYTANKRLRSDDSYTPGGRAGYRPDYPSEVYTKILKNLFPDVPVVLGGVEASMRRIAHYDYWKNSVEPSILTSSGADMIIYGMGENPVRELARLLQKGVPFSSLTTIPQTVVAINKGEKHRANKSWDEITLPSFKEVKADKIKFAEAFVIFEKESNRIDAARLLQDNGERTVIVNPPGPLMTTVEADKIYDLPFTRLPHPRYNKKPAIPAFEMIKYSITMHRGCFGGCSFCAIAAHQGKHVVSRSKESILREVETYKEMPDFKGVISDIGGPSANMYMMKGMNLELCRKCARSSCIWPGICKNLDTDHGKLVDLYNDIRTRSGLKRFFVTSGIRYDLLSKKFNSKAGKAEAQYLEDIIRYHVSGRFKVAPEHSSAGVLNVMRKTGFNLFVELLGKFKMITRKYNLNQEIIPYFISSHPGCKLSDMGELAVETSKLGMKLEQVQDFTPTPLTMATTIFYTGFDPYTGVKMFVARTDKDKRSQKRMFFWYKPENRKAIRDDLKQAGRSDLVNSLFKAEDTHLRQDYSGQAAHKSQGKRRRSKRK